MWEGTFFFLSPSRRECVCILWEKILSVVFFSFKWLKTSSISLSFTFTRIHNHILSLSHLLLKKRGMSPFIYNCVHASRRTRRERRQEPVLNDLCDGEWTTFNSPHIPRNVSRTTHPQCTGCNPRKCWRWIWLNFQWETQRTWCSCWNYNLAKDQSHYLMMNIGRLQVKAMSIVHRTKAVHIYNRLSAEIFFKIKMLAN